ncbi:MAG: NifU family protein [Actinobacteria bacterium]|nr:NifU family protein [Actinomycetota bacterium]
MATFEDLLAGLEQLFARLETLDEPVREQVLELLDGIDTMHRLALRQLVAQLDGGLVATLRAGGGAAAWLLDAYGLGLDERAAADEALQAVRPYIHSHGGEVEVLGAEAGVVSLRLSGACSGCTASAVTLREGVEEALRERMPGFLRIDVEEDAAAPHPPPAPLLQIQPLTSR